MKKMVFALFAVLVFSGFAFADYISTFQYFSGQREFGLTYKVSVQPVPDNKGMVKVWIPLGKSFPGQEVTNRQIDAPGEYKIVQDSKFGNDVLFYETEYKGDKPLDFIISYTAKRFTSRGKDLVSSPEELEKYLIPSRLTIPNETVKKWAAEAVEGRTSTLDKARGIYDKVMTHMTYDKKTPGYGNGDTIRACEVGKGNCTDFHSLFISMAREVNIPARFKIGFTVPKGKAGSIKGYHCWAEYYDEKSGWQQVDISDAWKKQSKVWQGAYFSRFDTNKFLVNTGRDLKLDQAQSTDPINIFFYPHVEVNGKKSNKLKTSFQYKTK